MMNDIKLFHFLSGEDVLAEQVEPAGAPTADEFGMLTLRNPCVVVMQRDPSNPDRIGIQLQPWCPFTEEKNLQVSRSHVVYIAEPVQDLVNQFNKIFGSGIVVARAGDVPTTPATLHRIK
jgi:hypothetical protein